ncbi:MAG: hypothetical protein K9L68_00080 [Spirochaetales bacterium]|nr:hypothetical protein [Spirochaetales bacterium]MCF7936975.1 hypothetical protein [Spirochaetales bacterium]
MKIHIVYYSHSGNNEALAAELQRRLGCEVTQIMDAKRRTGFSLFLDSFFDRKLPFQIRGPHPDFTGLVIFVGPVWNYRIGAPLKNYIRSISGELGKFAFLTICTGRKRQHQKLNRQLLELTGREPRAIAELCVNDLLPEKHRGKIKYAGSYQVGEEALRYFDASLRDFLNHLAVN